MDRMTDDSPGCRRYRGVCIERGAWTCRSAVLCQVNSREGRLFPGLLLEAFVAGGTTDVGASRALLTVTV
jgi:hypothetical protein